jgi:hypothetical protein
MGWEVLHFSPEFEISTVYPYPIRNATSHREVKEYADGEYLKVALGRQLVFKHRLIAENWLPNPDNLPEVHHINGDGHDNHASNLMWVTSKTNCNNKFRYLDRTIQYVGQLTPLKIEVPVYGKWQFEDLYYDDGYFWKWTGLAYRQLPELELPAGFVTEATDINGKQHLIYYSKFARLYLK